jgi:hypothetical protein
MIGLIFNSYIFLLSIYNKLFIYLNKSDTKPLNYLGIFDNSSKLSLSKFIDLELKNTTQPKDEVLLVSKLFRVKKELDFISYSILNFERNSRQLVNNYNIDMIYNSDLSKTPSTKSILSLESSFSITDYNSKYDKSSFTDLSIKKSNTNPFVAHILENSLKSTTDTASANR